MKVLSCLTALLSFATAIALPSSAKPALGGRQITDPIILAELRAQHAHTLSKMKHGEKVLVHVDELSNYEHDPLQKRLFILWGLAGAALVEAIGVGGDIIGEILHNLLKVFLGDDHTIWHDEKHCRTYFQTHAGSEGNFRTYNRGSEDADTDMDMDITWNNPQSTDPPVYFFENDFLGRYSVQFTATDEVAWDGIEGTEKCNIQGICNPQYVFYHNGYNIVLNTWQSQGEVAACQYSEGEDCKGLCASGVKDQFTKNGVVWGGDCAIPCKDEGGDAYAIQPAPNTTFSMMVVGDSISHGMEADWTWRWRIFSWLHDTLGNDVTFVGPFSGTHGPVEAKDAQPQPPLLPGESAPVFDELKGLYADGVPEYFHPSGHASWWGRQAAQSKDTIKDWVSTYQPDYLLILLGFNDLGWFVSGPEDLVGNMGALIENAREAKSDVKILLGNVVHRRFLEGRQDLVDNTIKYNQLLNDTYQNWFRWESPIAYVDVNSNYNCHPEDCPDGYDGLHPNFMGEYHIAEAFARSLKADFGFQGPDFEVPTNPELRYVTPPAGAITQSFPEGLYTSWNMVETARGYEIRARLQGMTDWWSDEPVYPNTWASWRTWVIDGQTWEFQVRTKGDNDDVSDWSDLTSATAHLQTSPGPENITAVPFEDDGIHISWDEVTGNYSVNRYGVIVWDLDTEGAVIETTAAEGTSLYLGALKPGHRYGTWVSTYVNMESSITGQPYAAGGMPAAGPEVIVGGGTPAPPTDLEVTNTDATTVQLTWTASANAAMYGVYVRSVQDNNATDFKLDGQTAASTYGVAYLFPGTWNYEFCVTAYNGNLESARTACVIPPVYPGYSKRDEVPVGGNSTVVVNNSPVYHSTYNSTTMMEDKRLSKLFKLLSQSTGNSSVPQI